jgi:hypothetical protein
MNPPTVGHSKLISALDDAAKMNDGDAFLFVTHSVNKPADYKRAAKADTAEGVAEQLRNPLPWSAKISFIGRILDDTFPDVILSDNDSIRTLGQALNFLHEQEYTDVTIVAGSDRVPEFDHFLERYAADPATPEFESLDTISGGERDPDSDGVEGMSGTKLRTIVLEGDRDAFASAIDTNDDQLIGELFDAVSAGLEIPEQYRPKAEAIMAEGYVQADKLDSIYEDYTALDFKRITASLAEDGYQLSQTQLQEVLEIMKEEFVDKTRTAAQIAHVIHARPVDVLPYL